MFARIYPFLAALACLVVPACLWAQTPSAAAEKPCEDSAAYCKPKVTGMPTGPFLEIRRTQSFRQTFRTDVQGQPGTLSGFLNEREAWTVKVKVPLYASPSFQAALGFEGHFEEAEFAPWRQSLSINGEEANLLFDRLDDRGIRQYGARVYLLKSWPGRHYLGFRGGVNVLGPIRQRTGPAGDYLSITASPAFGFKPDDRTAYAFGITYRRQQGRSLVLPFMVYNKTFSDRWGLESTLPAKAAARYTINPKTLLYGGFSLKGSNITLPGETDEATWRFRQNELQTFVRLDREIAGIAWMDAEVGVSWNMIYTVDDLTGSGRPAPITSNTRVGPGLYAAVGFYLVPPSRFSNR